MAKLRGSQNPRPATTDYASHTDEAVSGSITDTAENTQKLATEQVRGSWLLETVAQAYSVQAVFALLYLLLNITDL